MAKKKNNRNSSKEFEQRKKISFFTLPEETKKLLFGILMFLLAIIFGLSFFDLSGIVGKLLIRLFLLLVGKAIFLFPLIFILAGLSFLYSKYKKFIYSFVLAAFFLILGVSGTLEILKPGSNEGGYLGYVGKLFLKLFGFWVTQIIFLALSIISLLIFWQLLNFNRLLVREEKTKLEEKKLGAQKPLISRLVKRIMGEPKLKLKEIEPPPKISPSPLLPGELPELKLKSLGETKKFFYQPPLLNLLESEKEIPNSGDIKINSATIKKTLQNFDIPVEMCEVNIGPTVTQYTLKPAEGIKLSKITSLSNDLSLSLASHPIRIEAPIPGRSLVGVEIPNKTRAKVHLRDLISNQQFQKAGSDLTLVLGKDVSGIPVYADLSKMPHLLVAGSTGAGKTCAADTLIFTEKGILTFEELCPLPLNSETDFKVKLVTRDGIETTSKNYNNGICQFYKLSTSRGYQIEATGEHPLWVMNEDGSQGWKAASLIKKSDYAAISRGPALFGNRTDLSNFKPSKIKSNYYRKISFPSKMTPQLAQFLGFLTADGGLSVEKGGTHRVVYTQANSHLIRLYKKSLKELFGITRFIEKRSGSNPKNKAFDIVIGSKHLKEFLLYLGMNSSKSPQKEIPRAIREAPKKIVIAYLRALFDNDGYVGKSSVEFCISSKKLASQVHLALLNFGIVSSLTIKKVKNYAHNEYYRLSIFGEEARKFIQEIGFIRKEKYNKIREFLKLSPNPNVDLIPHISSLIRELGQKYFNRFVCLTNRGWKYQQGILVPKYAFNSLKSYNSGYRNPGYQSLEKILEFYQLIPQEPEYQELEKISKRNFYWDKIEKIERTSGVGYDFYVPGSDSFVGNGLVNHNTIFLNSLILSLLYRPPSGLNPFGGGPEILRFILVDPKRVEFPVYNGLPHLLCPVICDSQRAINALKWLISEMERRFDFLSRAQARDILSYNKLILEKDEEPLPYIVLIIDELADLMAARGKEVEVSIVRIAQMARAVGIHLVVATQRPSVEVITGLIKANITSRISFQVASQIDSRTILDMAGSEKLLGLGDFLFISTEVAKPKRIQAAYTSDKEVKKVVEYIRAKSKVQSSKIEDELLTEDSETRSFIGNSNFQDLEEDPLYEDAKKLVIEARKASASLLQRRLRLGYARAARLIDTLEERGVVGPADGAKPREILLKNQEENPAERDPAGGGDEQDDWKKV